MSVRQFPESGTEKNYPFGTSGSFTFDRALDSGVYDVDITGNDSFAASTNALTISHPDGYTVPVHLDTGEGVVSIPWDESVTIHAASISTPSIVSFSKIKYDQGAPIEGLTVSFDVGFSGSYVVDGTLPEAATGVRVFYAEGVEDTVSASALPVSFDSYSFDYDDAFSSSIVSMAIAYLDDKGVLSKSVNDTYTFPTPSGTFASGGVTSNDGTYRYHTFTSNGTLTVTTDGPAEYVIVAGGGGGGASNPGQLGAGAGGAGGFVSGSLSLTGSYSITIGGGAGGGVTQGGGFPPTGGSKGGTTLLGSSASAEGGGSGGAAPSGGGGSGGSGGGAGRSSSSAGSGNPGQGFPGGNGTSATTGGGGGGAGESGNTDGGGEGGDGSYSASAYANATGTGVSGYYAGGGGGGAPTSGLAGGLGGGGNGDPSGTNGTANTGGGGGGGYSSPGQSGGSGIVIIRYLL